MGGTCSTQKENSKLRGIIVVTVQEKIKRQYGIRFRSGERLAMGLGSEDWMPVGVRSPTPVQTGPGAHLAFYTMGTGSLSRG